MRAMDRSTGSRAFEGRGVYCGESARNRRRLPQRRHKSTSRHSPPPRNNKNIKLLMLIGVGEKIALEFCGLRGPRRGVVGIE